MTFQPFDYENKEIQFNEILDSFRTKFWIDEHQQFVQCHWKYFDKRFCLDSIDLFTLPYAFRHFSGSTSGTRAKSTCPNDDYYW